MVCCGPLAADADDYFEADPKLIVEVLSPKTATIDDGEKRVNYQTLDSLEEYLLLDPKSREVVLYRRSGAFWTRISFNERDEIELLSTGFNRALGGFVGSD